jgi:hypothetical protein
MDHVVPDCIWHGHLPLQIITVPCCAACNIRWSKDEGYFRTVVAAMGKEDAHPDVQRIIGSKLQHQLMKDCALRKSFIADFAFRTEILPSGIAVIRPTFHLDREKFNRVAGKIVRGLVFKERQRRAVGKPAEECFLPPTHQVQIFFGPFWEEPDIRALIDGMTDPLNMGVGDNTFIWRRVRDRGDEFRMAYLLLFYQSVAIFALTVPLADAKWPDPSASS